MKLAHLHIAGMTGELIETMLNGSWKLMVSESNKKPRQMMIGKEFQDQWKVVSEPKFCITDGRGNYATRRTLTSEFSLIDSIELSYTWTESEAAQVAEMMMKEPKFHGVKLFPTPYVKPIY